MENNELFIWIRISIVIVLILTAISNIWRKPFFSSPIRSSNGLRVLIAYPLILQMAIWWFKGDTCSTDTFYLLSIDTYDRAHPVIYAIIIKGLYGIFGSIKSIILVQILLMSIACGMIVMYIYHYKLPWLYAILGSSLAIFGSHGYIGFTTMAIKDALYYPFFITLMVGLCSWCLRENKKAHVIIIISLIGIGVFRYDGQLIVAGTTIFFLAHVYFRKLNFWRHAAFLCIPLICTFFCSFTLPKILHVGTKYGMGTQYAMPAEMICEAVVHDGELSSEERRRISEVIMPIELIREYHDAGKEHEGQKYIWHCGKHSFAKSLDGKGKELLSLFIPIACKNPGIMIKHVWHQSYMLTHGHDYSSACFYIIIALMFRLQISKTPLHFYVPFIPIVLCMFICVIIATTYETRYAAPIVGGCVVLYLYVHTLLYHKKIIQINGSEQK